MTLKTNSDKLDQHIRKLQKLLRKPPVKPTQTHKDKRKDSKIRRRNKNYED